MQQTLNIITPLFRYENLPIIYNSIPKKEDIIWHISKTNRREKIDYDFIKLDKRIKMYEIDCDDKDLITKRNVIFDNIKSGHFHLLDDDTLFHPFMYSVYENNKDFVGMIIGRQVSKDMKLRLVEGHPIYCHIDAGNVLCHSSILEKVKWQDKNGFTNAKDFVFWDNCFKVFGKNNTKLIPQVISIYNKLNH